MQITNIRHHRIRWRLLAAQGIVVGVLSALVMLAIAMLAYPMFVEGADGWTFSKVVSTALLGDSAADPLSGFVLVPVTVGFVVHLAIGACAGASYAVLIAMFDLEGWTPVALFGLIYGAVLFVWSSALVGIGAGGEAIGDLPLVVMLWGNIVFGLAAGVLLATWADRADIDQIESERVPAFEGDRPSRRASMH
jgi:hypothetical protein